MTAGRTPAQIAATIIDDALYRYETRPLPERLLASQGDWAVEHLVAAGLLVPPEVQAAPTCDEMIAKLDDGYLSILPMRSPNRSLVGWNVENGTAFAQEETLSRALAAALASLEDDKRPEKLNERTGHEGIR